MKLFEMFDKESKYYKPGTKDVNQASELKKKALEATYDTSRGLELLTQKVTELEPDIFTRYGTEYVVDIMQRVLTLDGDLDELAADTISWVKNPDYWEGDDTVSEDAPPGMEDWIKDRKPEFKKRYGDRWEEVLYATAWKQHNAKNESVNEEQQDPYDYINSVSHAADMDWYELYNELVGAGYPEEVADKVASDYRVKEEVTEAFDRFKPLQSDLRAYPNIVQDPGQRIDIPAGTEVAIAQGGDYYKPGESQESQRLKIEAKVDGKHKVFFVWAQDYYRAVTDPERLKNMDARRAEYTAKRKAGNEKRIGDAQAAARANMEKNWANKDK